MKMNRRNLFKNLSLLSLIPISRKFGLEEPPGFNFPENEREYWVGVLTKIADPLLESLSRGELKQKMPVECKPGLEDDRKKVTYLEAFGRLLAGMAPWLELGEDNSKEGLLRKKYINLARKSLKNAVDPQSPDFLNFNEGKQPLVDAAFLAHAILRAPRELWGKLDEQTKSNLVAAMKSSREITPYYSNWLLFSAMVETFLLFAGEDWDEMRVDLVVRKHLEWYLGDGIYGDGPEFHWDYYNSYVIQPMLLDILRELSKDNPNQSENYQKVLKRSQRYAAIQERLISPEGTFPPIGRSLPYRFGAFQMLSQTALQHNLPEEIKPSQVRSALTSVIQRMMEAPRTFDKNGWLTIGFCGHQPDIAESYISTGSVYLCSVGLLALGLPPEDPFWSGKSAEWTSKQIWNGKNLPADHAIND